MVSILYLGWKRNQMQEVEHIILSYNLLRRERHTHVQDLTFHKSVQEHLSIGSLARCHQKKQFQRNAVAAENHRGQLYTDLSMYRFLYITFDSLALFFDRKTSFSLNTIKLKKIRKPIANVFLLPFILSFSRRNQCLNQLKPTLHLCRPTYLLLVKYRPSV